MAYSVLDELKKDALNCVLCFQVPGEDDDDSNIFKQLSCNHIFCKNCLVKWVKPDDGRITCPTCRKETVLDNTVDNLPLAFQATHIIDWINKKQGKELEGEMTNRQCPDHKVPNNFFCTDCNEYVCGDCLALTHNRKHKTLHIKAEAESKRKEVQEMIRRIDTQLVHWRKAEDQKRQVVNSIEAEAATAMASVSNYLEQVGGTLVSTREWLGNAIKHEQEAKSNAVKKEMEAITNQIGKFEHKMEIARNSLKYSDDYKIFKEHAGIVKILEEVLDNPPAILTNQTPADSFRFTPNLIAIKRCQKDIMRMGKVHKSNESLILVRRESFKDTSQFVLQCMKNVVKRAYELNVREMSPDEERQAKCIFIVEQLQEACGEKWSCIIGDFTVSVKESLHWASFIVNKTDRVFIFKTITTDAAHEGKNAVQKDKKHRKPAKLLHNITSSKPVSRAKSYFS
ncbi:tripartite motif-containing 13-like [Anneissia japonica]|uniref:tripartite motif-containing 13-like n=1 Tax=Anneissia japonica TaxID=1529436 RepID=UPI0014259FDB|nr:tripartite motif-containing 13-like [Anneissia japonica]